MAIYTNLPVFEDTYLLMLQCVGLCRKMERDIRFSLGEQLKRCVMDICVLIYRANKAEAKAETIASAREKLVEAQLLLRLFNELHQLSDKQFVIPSSWLIGRNRAVRKWNKVSKKQKRA